MEQNSENSSESNIPELDPRASLDEYIQYYLDYYPNEFLVAYPEFLAGKPKRQDLQKWIKDNLDPDQKQRSKSDIERFFRLNYRVDIESDVKTLTEEKVSPDGNTKIIPAITRRDIAYAGW